MAMSSLPSCFQLQVQCRCSINGFPMSIRETDGPKQSGQLCLFAPTPFPPGESGLSGPGVAQPSLGDLAWG